MSAKKGERPRKRDNPQNYRKLILTRLRQYGMTRGELAYGVQEKYGLSNWRTYAYLSGKQDINSDNLAYLLAYLGITVK